MNLNQAIVKKLIQEELDHLFKDQIHEAFVAFDDPVFDLVKDIKIPETNSGVQEYNPTLLRRFSTATNQTLSKMRGAIKSSLKKMKDEILEPNELNLDDVFAKEGSGRSDYWPDSKESFEEHFGMSADSLQNEFAALYWRAWTARRALQHAAVSQPEKEEEILAALPIEDVSVSLATTSSSSGDEPTAAGLGQDKGSFSSLTPTNRSDEDISVKEASSEKQRKWACANKDEQPKLAHICADTALSGKKKKKK